jgi:hypothetical protein
MPTVVAEIFPPRAASSRGQSYQISRRRPCSCPAATGLMTRCADRTHDLPPGPPTPPPDLPPAPAELRCWLPPLLLAGPPLQLGHRPPAPPPGPTPARKTRPPGHLHPPTRPPPPAPGRSATRTAMLAASTTSPDATSVGPTVPPPSPTARAGVAGLPSRRPSQAATRPPLPSGRPLLMAHRPPCWHPCSRPSSAQSRHRQRPILSSQHCC